MLRTNWRKYYGNMFLVITFPCWERGREGEGGEGGGGGEGRYNEGKGVKGERDRGERTREREKTGRGRQTDRPQTNLQRGNYDNYEIILSSYKYPDRYPCICLVSCLSNLTWIKILIIENVWLFIRYGSHSSPAVLRYSPQPVTLWFTHAFPTRPRAWKQNGVGAI